MVLPKRQEIKQEKQEGKPGMKDKKLLQMEEMLVQKYSKLEVKQRLL